MESFLNKHKKKIVLVLFCIVVSFITLFFCSKNSFFYCYNDWVDENAFHTMGRGWLNGLVPYRDLFEQKGPLLYALFALGSFFSSHSFFPIFCFEVLSMTVFCYYASKIITLFLKPLYVYLILPLLVSVITSSIAFVHGGSAEEFCLPLFMITLYHLLSFLKKDEKSMKYSILFVNGLIAGAIAMIKYNLLGFHFVFMATIFFILLRKKEIKRAFKSCFFFLLGMSLPILSFFFYFGLVGGFSEFIEAYFLYNIKGYSNEVATSLFVKLKMILTITLGSIRRNVFIYPLFFLGVFFIVCTPIFLKKVSHRIVFLLLMLILPLGIYFGLIDLLYYILPLFIFIVFGLIGLFSILEKEKRNKINLVFRLGLTFVLSAYFISTSGNLSFHKTKKKDLAQFQFANIIKKEKHPTLLNYGFLDGGFYLASDILPSIRYFELQNGTPEGLHQNIVAQNKAIEDQKVMFVVTRELDSMVMDISFIEQHYEEVASHKQPMEVYQAKYRLWKVRKK